MIQIQIQMIEQEEGGGRREEVERGNEEAREKAP